MQILTVLIIFFSLAPHIGSSEFVQNLSVLTNCIISKYFTKFRCFTYVTDNISEYPFLTNMLPVYLVTLNGDEKTENKLLTESYEQGCGGYVIQVDYEARSSIIRRLKNAKHKAIGFRYNNQRYLFLPTNINDSNTDFVEDSEMYFFPNFELVVPEEQEFSIVSHTLFDHHKHEVLDIKQEVMDVWTKGNGFKFSRDLFPDRIKNVRGKKFVFSMVQYSPFSIVISEGNKTIFDGFETRIAAQFVETVNGTWEGLDNPVDLWGELYPNGTGTGIVGSVRDHVADFGYAAIYQWFCEILDCTYPFYQSDVTCLVPRPKLVSGWLTIILPYTTDTWIALITFYFINTTFVLFIILTLQYIKGHKISNKIGLSLSDSFFTVFRLQLEQIPMIPKSKEPLAVYIKISVCYYFFVAAFWQGGIASILTVPRYEKSINTAIDLLEKWPKIEWGANTNAWINSIKASSTPSLAEIAKKFLVLDDETLLEKTKMGNFGFFIEKLPHGHYGHNDYLTEDGMKYLRLMESNLYSAFGVLILPKGSPYLENFDRTVIWMFDTGLIHKVEVQVSLDRVNNRLQNMIRYSNEKDASNVVLAVRHIQEPLFIYLLGMISAILVFFIEKIVMPKFQQFASFKRFQE